METTVQNNTNRKKTIIVATVALVLILIIGIWAITSALSKTKKNDTNKVSDASSTTKVEDNQAKPATNPADNSPSNQYTVAPTDTNTTVVVPTTQENMPTTGPESIIISAIALGIIASLSAYNIQLVNKKSQQ